MTSLTPRPAWRLLGDPWITWNGRELTPRLGKKAIGLIAYLAIVREGATRDELARILWPPVENARELARAKQSVRQCLVTVRKAFGEAYDTVIVDADNRLVLRPDTITLDVQRLGEIEAQGDPAPEELAELCRGPFLRSLATRSRPFDDWAAEKRAELSRRAGQMLEAAHAAAEVSGDRTLAAKLNDAMDRMGLGRFHLPSTELHPGEIVLPPVAPRRRWTSHIAAGFAALAIGFGAAYWLSSEFKTFFDGIINPAPSVPVLAVLPFTTQPGTDENIALAIKQDVEHGLQKISELIAISPAPLVTRNDLSELTTRARKLKVRYLILGLVRGKGKKVEIDVQCFDAISGQFVWSEQYEEAMEQGYDLSKRVTLRILNELDIPVTKARIEQLNDTDNIQAWLAAAQGLSHLIKMTSGDITFAEDYYNEALRYDTGYCSAHRGLAWVAVLKVRLAQVRSVAEAKEMLAEARRQLGFCLVDPKQAERGTTKSLQGAILLLEEKFDEAIRAGEAAVADLPNSPDTHAIFAHTLTYVGQHQRALDEINLAMQLSEIEPAWYRWTRGRALRLAGHFEDSVKQLKQDEGTRQSVLVHRVELAASYAAAGQLDKARGIAKFLKLGNRWPGVDEWMKHPRLKDPEIAARERQYLVDAGL